jgi:hypothetical protein
MIDSRLVCMSLLLLISGALIGCAKVRWYERTESAREASLRLYEDETIDGMPLPRYVATHTAMLFANYDVEAKKTEDGWHIDWEKDDAELDAHRGLAVPITNDGYFLTARHAVDKANLKLFLPRQKDLIVDARVVWRDTGDTVGWDDRHPLERDMAIIHAPIEWDRGVPRARLTDVNKGDAVVVGARGGKPVAGHFWDRLKSESGDAASNMTWFVHTAPSIPGDSGGPVFLADGSLIGINHAIGGVTFKFLFLQTERNTTRAIAPDWSKLMKIIEDDRAHSATQPGEDHLN